MYTKQYAVYILTNPHNTVLYIGVTNNLVQRVFQHKNKLSGGFTSRYNITKLVYFELYDESLTAIEREKQLKAGSRKKKVDLIERNNPDWQDLYDTIA